MQIFLLCLAYFGIALFVWVRAYAPTCYMPMSGYTGPGRSLSGLVSNAEVALSSYGTTGWVSGIIGDSNTTVRVNRWNTTHGMIIPATWPRLWFNTPALLSAGQAWYAANPFDPVTAIGVHSYVYRIELHAMRGLPNNEASHCTTAVYYFFTTMPTLRNPPAGDDGRGYGESFALIHAPGLSGGLGSPPAIQRMARPI